jgi:hypothetical protein
VSYHNGAGNNQSYCCHLSSTFEDIRKCNCIFIYLHRASWHSSATLTEVYPCFFLSLQVLPGQTRNDGVSSALFRNLCVVLCIVCFVSFCVLFLCKCVLYYCHRVATLLHLTNILYHIYHIVYHILYIAYHIMFYVSYVFYFLYIISYTLSYTIYHIISYSQNNAVLLLPVFFPYYVKFTVPSV